MDLSRIENFQDAVVTVMGLGRYKQGSGLGATKWLLRHGAQVVITDLKTEDELKESVDLVTDWYKKYRTMYADRTIYQPLFVLGEHRREDFLSVDCVVQNPGVPSESEYIVAAKNASVSIESDVSLFFRFYPHPIIAVTGTKGKTTTTFLLGEMLKLMDAHAVVAGNVKVSPLEMLDELLTRGTPTPVVLELSSWLLESLPNAFTDLGKGPDIAVLTNVYPDHLNRYASFDDYIASKEIIFRHQTGGQVTILNHDHDRVRAMEPRVKGKLLWTAQEPMSHSGCYVKDGTIVVREILNDTSVLALADVALKGEHNVENILAATAAAHARGVPVESIAKVLREFTGVPDRQEIVREVDEITYVNDTTATIPDAMFAALRAFGKNKDVVLIAGGVNKGMTFDMLGDELVRACKTVILLPGDASDLIEKVALGKVPLDRAGTMEEAVVKAHAAATRGDTVLLSPGAASMNIFANEFDRGEQFREEVRKL